MTKNMSDSASKPGKKAILLVDDHPLLRRGLSALLTGEPDLWVCGEVSTCQGAFQAIAKHYPDVAIVDLGLEAGDGMELIKDLAALTDRQLEVFRLIGRGHGAREMAERIKLSIKTIESHRENLKQKLRLKSSAALVQSATRWIDTGEVSLGGQSGFPASATWGNSPSNYQGSALMRQMFFGDSV